MKPKELEKAIEEDARLRERGMTKLCDAPRIPIYKPRRNQKRPAPTAKCFHHFEGTCDRYGKPHDCPLTDEEWARLPEISVKEIHNRIAHRLPASPNYKEF